MSGAAWTPEMNATLRVLWDEGHSTEEIARRMKTSKNAVCGRAHRLLLPPRQSPIKRLGPGRQRKRPVRAKPAGRVTLPPIAVVKVAPPPVVATQPAASLPIVEAVQAALEATAEVVNTAAVSISTFLASSPRACQFPMWGRVAPPQPPLFCGAPCAVGRSYCDHHHRRCYTRSGGAVRTLSEAGADAGDVPKHDVSSQNSYPAAMRADQDSAGRRGFLGERG